MSDLLSLIENAEKRYYNRNVDIDAVLNKIRQGDGSSEETSIHSTLHDAEVTKERVFGNKDFLPIAYLEKGLQASKTVGRIVIRNSLGNTKGYGTGFLVSPNLLLTNNHVLPDAVAAGCCEIEFDYENGLDGRIKKYPSFSLDPASFFLSSPADELDYTLIAVEEFDRQKKVALSSFGFMPLLSECGEKITLGECLTIIQHPRGELKQITVRENKLIDMDKRFLRYQTDTAPGSSGSMVVNDQWEVVALHHSGVPKRNEQNAILARDGRPWDKKTMKEEDIDWIANEGVRVESIIKDINDQLKSYTGKLKPSFL
jgi:endonuclease G